MLKARFDAVQTRTTVNTEQTVFCYAKVENILSQDFAIWL